MGLISNTVILLALYLIVMIDRLIVQGHEPLIFNPFSLAIYSREAVLKEWNNGEYPFAFALACPARHDSEIEFDKNFSLDKKSLFLTHFFKNGESMGDFTCEADYKLAVVYHTISRKQFIEFGFEVYYDPEDQNEVFKTAKYDAYEKIGGKIRGEEMPIGQMINSILNGPTLINEQGKAHKMNFIWLAKILLSYDQELWTVKTLIYKVGAKAHERKAKCQDYSLGNRLYTTKPNNGDKFYLQTNQENVFSSVQLPTSLSDDCTVRYNCVKKYNLAPPHSFQPSESSPTICSDLTTIPVWYEIEKLLVYLEKFITVIAMLTKNGITVTTGTLDILNLPLKDGSKPQLMHLFAAEKRIPIPEIIYRTIAYKTYDCKDPQHKLCWFGLVVVIHNEPEFSSKRRICPTDECEDLGWESIQYASADKKGKTKSNRIYCCAYQKANHKQMGFNQDKAVKGELSLKSFPHYDGKSHRNLYEDRQAEFEDKLKELFPENGAEK